MKKLTVLLLTLLLLLSVIGTVGADSAALLDYVIDEADILTAEESIDLNDRAAALTDRYQCGVYIITVEDYLDYTTGDVMDCAMDLYESYDLGYGTEKHGILLLLSMADRDYALVAYGNTAHTAFTDYGKEELAKEFLDDFGDDFWYEGFEDYLSACDEYLAAAEDGNPIDVGSNRFNLGALIFVILVPLLVAGLICLVMLGSMRTAKRQANANAYVIPGSLHLQVQRDLFTHRTVHRQRIQRSSGSRSGGTSVNSRGFSGSKGKF